MANSLLCFHHKDKIVIQTIYASSLQQTRHPLINTQIKNLSGQPNQNSISLLSASASALRSGPFLLGRSSSDAILSFKIGLLRNRSRALTNRVKMDHDETGCQAPPDRPILCVNNCGFFGSAATMNMCSKCHKDMLMKQEQAKLAVSSIGSIVDGSSSSNGSGILVNETVNVQINAVEPKTMSAETSCVLVSGVSADIKPKEGPSRCSTCKKRVGLTGFKCRCGNLFCASHRYSDKHDCQFDYRTAAREAIAKANPIVKAEKLEKI